MKWYLIVLLLVNVECVSAQGSSSVCFEVTFDDESLELDKNYYLNAINDSVKFTNVKFYISDIQLSKDKQQVIELNKKHHLIDVADKETRCIKLPYNTRNFNKVSFKLGVDSITNHAGALGGDLDPTNGMYWTWQSGYINFKLEGSSPACSARKNKFQYHIGGFQYPYNTVRTIELVVYEHQEELVISIPVDKLLSTIDLRKIYQVMSPNEGAMKIASQVAEIFQLSK